MEIIETRGFKQLTINLPVEVYEFIQQMEKISGNTPEKSCELWIIQACRKMSEHPQILEMHGIKPVRFRDSNE